MQHEMEGYKPFEDLSPVELKRVRQFPYLAEIYNDGNKIYWKISKDDKDLAGSSLGGRSKYKYDLRSRRSVRKRGTKGRMR